MIRKSLRDLIQPKLIVRVLVMMVLIAVGTVGYLYVTRPASPLPSQIQKQLTFSPLVIPINTKNYKTSDYKFATTEDKVQTLTYITHIKSGTVTVSVSEQPQPPQFVEITGYKDSFLSNVAKQYATVQSSNGVIYLGRLARQNNKQVGIMLEKGLLVIMTPSKELDSAQWRLLGDHFELQKVDN